MTTLVKRGSSGQVRAPRRDGWTKAKRARFLEVLSTTCNVTAAAAGAGVTTHTAYALRRRDGMFAQLWSEAVQHGTELLHEALISRALGHGDWGENPDFTPGDAAPAAFDPKLAIDVLKMQAGTLRPRRAGTPPTQVVIDTKVLERLEALARTLARP